MTDFPYNEDRRKLYAQIKRVDDKNFQYTFQSKFGVTANFDKDPADRYRLKRNIGYSTDFHFYTSVMRAGKPIGKWVRQGIIL